MHTHSPEIFRKTIAFCWAQQSPAPTNAIRYRAVGSVKLNCVTPFSLVAQISPPCAPTMVFAM